MDYFKNLIMTPVFCNDIKKQKKRFFTTTQAQ